MTIEMHRSRVNGKCTFEVRNKVTKEPTGIVAQVIKATKGKQASTWGIFKNGNQVDKVKIHKMTDLVKAVRPYI